MAALPFGQNLRKYRRERGLTQEALAKQCGCRQGYISSLERGAFSPSMAIVEKVAAAFGLSPAELLMADEQETPAGFSGEGIPILNARSRSRLPSPVIEGDRVVGDSKKILCLPDVRGGDAFAAYLPDDAMVPDFGKGDLVVFSLVQDVEDGAAALVDLGDGHVLFRRVLRFPGGLRLEANRPSVEPVMLKEPKDIRMWRAIGRWEWLAYGRRR